MKFTINALKASAPIWRAVFNSWFNRIMLAGLAAVCIAGFIESAYAGCGFTFLSTWLFWHRFMLAQKNLVIEGLLKN